MSSIYRDIAQQMESIYKDIANESLEDLSKEELIRLLEVIKNEAKSSYISYSVELGWYKNHEQAEQELIEADEEDNAFVNEGYTAYQFELTDWIVQQKGLSSTEMVGFLEQETNKAYSIFIMKPIQDMKTAPVWFPKSQVIQKEEIPHIEP